MNSNRTKFDLTPPPLIGGRQSPMGGVLPPVPLPQRAPRSPATTAVATVDDGNFGLPLTQPSTAARTQPVQPAIVSTGAGGTWDPPPLATRAAGWMTMARGALMHSMVEAATNPRDWLANNARGAVKGMLSVPDRLAPTAREPDAVVEAVGKVAGMAGEAVAGEGALFRGLTFLAKSGVPGAARALKAFEAKEGAPLREVFAKSAALSVTAEAGAQGASVAYGDQSAGEALTNMRPVALMAGAAAAPAIARGVGSAAVQRNPALGEFLSRAAEPLRDRFQVDWRMRKYAGAEKGLELHEWNLADEFMAHRYARNAAVDTAVDTVRDMFARMALRSESAVAGGQMRYDGELTDHFLKLVRAHGDVVYAMKVAPENVDEIAELKLAFRELRDTADESVLEAFEQHVNLYGRVAEDVARYGGDPLKMFNPGEFTAPRSFGEYATNAIRANAYMQRAETDATFMARILSAQGKYMTQWDAAARDAFRKGQSVRGPDGVEYKMLESNALGRSGRRAWDTLVEEGFEVYDEATGALVGSFDPRKMVVPKEVAEYVAKAGVASEKQANRVMERVNDLTQGWKAGVLVHGLLDMALKNLVSDEVALVRSMPGIVRNPRAFAEALRKQRAYYGFGGRTPETVTYQDVASPTGTVEADVAMRQLPLAIPGKAPMNLSTAEFASNAALGFGVGGASTAVDGETNVPEFLIGGAIGALGITAARTGLHMVENRDYLSRIEGLIPEAVETRDEIRRLQTMGVTGSGLMGREVLEGAGAPIYSRMPDMREELGRDVATFGRAYGESVLTLLMGRKIGKPLVGENLIDTANTLIMERENFLRMAAFYHQKSLGVSDYVAAKRARESMVDYAKFTEFENKWFRGFLLPFYSYARHSVPNWIKAAAGRDVGGGGAASVGALAGMASFDVVSQAWNELFDEEDAMPAEMREQWHIIAGWPKILGGEGALRDASGKVIRIGAEMPYEMPLELLGLARPGALMSQAFGEMSDSESLVARWQRKEEFDLASEATRAIFAQTANEFRGLLTPLVQLPAEALTGTSIAFGSPIVKGYVDDAAWEQWTKHVLTRLAPGAQQMLQNGSDQSVMVARTDPDRALRWKLSDMMEQAQFGEKVSPAERALLNAMNSDEQLGVLSPESVAKVYELTYAHARDPKEVEALLRYYGRQVSHRSDLRRQWDALDLEARGKFLKTANEFEKAALFAYLNGRSIYAVQPAQEPQQP